jgi:hypothetical protein
MQKYCVRFFDILTRDVELSRPYNTRAEAEEVMQKYAAAACPGKAHYEGYEVISSNTR